MSMDRHSGVLRRGWSGAMDDYAIAGGWTKNGERLVVGDSAGSVSAFDGKSGAVEWAQKDSHEGGLLALAMHPGGTSFATAGQDGRVLIWDVTAGDVRHSVEVGGGWVDNVAWSPNGNWLVASCSRKVHLYSHDGKEVWQSEDHPSTVSAVAWAGAEELASACYGRVTFFDAASGEQRQKLEWKGSLVSLELSPDGDIVACGSQDNSVHFWRRSKADDSMMSGYSGKPAALSFDSSGTLLATSGSEVVTVWSFQGLGPEGTRPGALQLHGLPVSALAFARRGLRLASGGRDGAVVVWDLQEDGEGGPVGAALMDDVVAELYWRPDGRALAALDGQGVVTVWRI